MRLSYELTKENSDNLSKLFLTLSNPKRLKILLIVKQYQPITTKEVLEKAKKEGIYINRESVYMALEDLKEVKLISKKYDDKNKRLVYFIEE